MLGLTRRRLRVAAVGVLAAVGLSACGMFGQTTVLTRIDPSVNGIAVQCPYVIETPPNGEAETNVITCQGMNDVSPMPLVQTTFSRGASSVSQTAMVTDANGAQIAALSMNKRDNNFGVSEYLKSQVATYEQRDVHGNRVCGAKVRVTWQPLIAQQVLNDKYRRAWDALFYYQIDCRPQGAQPTARLELSGARFLGLVISQQFTPRIWWGEKPKIFNRGHAVTVVSGAPARLAGGWWKTNQGIENAANLVNDMAKDLDGHEWLGFGKYYDSQLVYSAGDADVYLSLQRLFLDRQVDYLVNFRSDPNAPWHRLLVHPIYNKEWNDFSQNWHALKGTDMPNASDLVDQDTGLPKDLDNPDSDNMKALKEIETVGCQNCPNPELEQIQFINPDTKQPLYAATVRGYLGAESSLAIFGQVPSSAGSLLTEADKARPSNGKDNQHCAVNRDEEGNRTSEQPYDEETCAVWLREGALWDLLTKDPSKVNADVVSIVQVRDNSAFASRCSGSGDSTSCSVVVTKRQMNASYEFTDAGEGLQRAWTVMQLLGEVGMRTLGLSYASGAFDGSGLDFAMAQSQVNRSYFSDLTDSQHPYNRELLFGLDARALQLPQTLAEASKVLYGVP
jgi:hypothetical protein